MRNNREYLLAKEVSRYLRLQYPKVLFHFDLAGLNLSRGQAGMMKVIQHKRGFPDLMVLQPSGNFNGLFIELKADGKNPYKKNGDIKSDEHLNEQQDMINELLKRGYKACFCTGFDSAKNVIDTYLK